MKFYYITFRSVTFAQRGESVLSARNIRCTLLRTPKWMEEQGCGYCLRLWTSDATPAVELLRQVKAKYPGKSIWAYSGYLFDRDICAGRLGPKEITEEYLSYLDVLVDGPFIQAQKDLRLRFRGSSNQRLIDVKASLAEGKVVLWEDWQEERRK